MRFLKRLYCLGRKNTQACETSSAAAVWGVTSSNSCVLKLKSGQMISSAVPVLTTGWQHQVKTKMLTFGRIH